VVGSTKNYRALAAECRKLAATASDAHSQAQYEALAEMWQQLAQETDDRRKSAQT
jgi:hypothetical protein